MKLGKILVLSIVVGLWGNPVSAQEPPKCPAAPSRDACCEAAWTNWSSEGDAKKAGAGAVFHPKTGATISFAPATGAKMFVYFTKDDPQAQPGFLAGSASPISADTCKDLKMRKDDSFQPPTPTGEEKKDGQGANVTDSGKLALTYGYGVTDVFADYAERTDAVAGGTHNALGDAAMETVQILGQIVATRASNAAFVRVKDALLKGLKCDAELSDKDAAELNKRIIEERAKVGASEEEGQGRPTAESEDPLAALRAAETKLYTPGLFQNTCGVVQNVRIQDLTTSRDAILVALAIDLMNRMQKVLPGEGKDTSWQVYSRLALQALGQDSTEASGEAARIIMARMKVHAEQNLMLSPTKMTPSDKNDELYARIGKEPSGSMTTSPVVAAVAAVLRCRLIVAGGGADRGACPVEDFAVEMLDSEDLDLKQFAAQLAIKLGTASVPPKGTDGRTRLRAAVEAGFDAACYEASFPTALQLGCRSLDAEFAPTEELQLALSGMRALSLAALNGDAASFVRDFALVLAKIESNLPDADRTRALRFVVAIANYGATYVSEQGKSDEELHAQRTKILESLVDEMTYRADRGGNWIVSVGGSLNMTGGARFPFEGPGPVFSGPFSLLLGFGVDYVPPKAVGFHVELAPMDLGQYLTWNAEGSGVEVLEPKPEALFAPTLAAGLSFGRELPFVLTAFAGYAPSYTNASGSGGGSLTVGGSFGVYVPLLDLN
jgi:hypothetical protein